MLDPNRNYTGQDEYLKRKKMAEEWELMKAAQAEESKARNETASKKVSDEFVARYDADAAYTRQAKFAKDPTYARLKYSPTTTDKDWEEYRQRVARLKAQEEKDEWARRNPKNKVSGGGSWIPAGATPNTVRR